MRQGTIPGPKGRWLVGDTLEYERDRLGWLLRTRENYGDIVRLAPGVVVLHDPQVIHSVLTSASAVPGRVGMTGKPSPAPQWTERRHNVWRHLDRSIIAAHLDRIGPAISTQIKGSSGTQIEVFSFTRSVSTAANVDFCAGPDRELAEAAETLFGTLIRFSSTNEPQVRWLPRPAARLASRASDHLRDLLLERVSRRRQAPDPAAGNLLGALPAEMPAEEAAEMLRVVLMASPGSPGAAAAWALLRLAERPDLATLAGSDTSYAAAFAKEVLRLHPPTWLLVRHVVSTMEVAGHMLPPGTDILISAYHLQRDARWWERPAAFDPSRWLQAASPHKPHAYLPFGAGRNTCPGGHLAMAQLTALIQTFAAGYLLDLPPLEEVAAEAGPLLLPAGLRGRWDPRP